MKRLEKDLNRAGYKTKCCNYVEESVVDVQADLYICGLSLRYSKSSMAAKEVEKIVDGYKKPLLTVLLDRTEFPPMGPMKKYFNRSADYIDCFRHSLSNSSDEFQELLNLIEHNLNGKNKHIKRSDSLNSLNRQKANPSNSLDKSNSDLSKRNSDVGRVRRGQEYKNFSNNNPPPQRKKKSDVEDQPYNYSLDGPKLPSVYRQRINGL